MKKLLIAAAALLISAPAFADRDHGHHKHWKHHDFRHHHSHAPRVVVVPRPVYVQPAPVYYYSRPAPVYYPPVPASGVSIRFNFPL